MYTSIPTSRSMRRAVSGVYRGLTVVAYGLNLNNAVDWYYTGQPIYVKQMSFFRPTIAIGFKYDFVPRSVGDQLRTLSVEPIVCRPERICSTANTTCRDPRIGRGARRLAGGRGRRPEGGTQVRAHREPSRRALAHLGRRAARRILDPGLARLGRRPRGTHPARPRGRETPGRLLSRLAVESRTLRHRWLPRRRANLHSRRRRPAYARDRTRLRRISAAGL